MSHFPVLVLVEPDADPEKRAEELLAPYDEAGEWFADGSRWDWWVVGGRWTGSLDGFDPTTDPLNWEPCSTCGGTGVRPEWPADITPEWIAECNGCNGCKGKGEHVRWSLRPYPGDIRPVAEITTGFVPYAVVTPDGSWHEEGRMGWWGVPMETHESPGDWGALAQTLLKAHRDSVAVLIDCHV